MCVPVHLHASQASQRYTRQECVPAPVCGAQQHALHYLHVGRAAVETSSASIIQHHSLFGCNHLADHSYTGCSRAAYAPGHMQEEEGTVVEAPLIWEKGGGHGAEDRAAKGA
jgi:hypothetical protein